MHNFLDFDEFKKHMLQLKASGLSKQHAVSVGTADNAFLDKLEAENNEDESSGWSTKCNFTEPQKGYVGKIYAKKVDGFEMMWMKNDLKILNS